MEYEVRIRSSMPWTLLKARHDRTGSAIVAAVFESDIFASIISRVPRQAASPSRFVRAGRRELRAHPDHSMEPVTHFLTGAAISRAGLNRKTALATLTLVLAAEAPDIDMVLYPFSRIVGFGRHRGITHTLFGAPFVAAGVLGFVYLLHQWNGKRRAQKEREKAAAEAARRAAKPVGYKPGDQVPSVIEPL